MNQREQNNTATSSSTRKTPSIAYIGWQSEYQRQYIWRQKLHPQKVSSNSNDYNRNYATAQNIIKPRAPILQGPVNHLIRDAVDSVVERPQTPTVEYEGYQRRYDQDFDNQLGYDETDDVDGGGDGDYYDDGETRNTPHVRFNANPASTTVSPTKSNFSESNNTEKSFSSHGAVFGSEPDTPKKVSYDRSVTVNPTSSTKKQAEPPHRQQSTNNNRPPMLNYGSGNTHPTSDEHFMKSFNSKVPPSQMYPHIEDRSTRIREYETSIKSQTEQKQHHYKPGSTTTTKPTTTAATTNKTPFKAMWDAQSDAYKASSSFHTEYQREYHSFGVEMGKRINGAGKPMNHIVSMKPTALSPQPPLGSNLNGPPPPSASYKNGHEDDEDEDEDSPDASSKPIAPITTHRNSSSPNKNTRLVSGKAPFHKRNENLEYSTQGGSSNHQYQRQSKRDIQLPIVPPPEKVPIDYNQDLQEYEGREKRTATMRLGSRVLQYHADPPSTWNLANDLLLRAQKRQAYNEQFGLSAQ